MPRLVPALLLALLLSSMSPRPAVAGWSENGVNLNGVNLNGVNLNGVNLNGVNLNGVNLNGVNLNGVNLNGVNLNGTLLEGNIADAPGSSCSHSELTTGSKLPSSCSKCAQIVGARDSYCTYNYWDGICVDKAEYYCSIDSFDLDGAELSAEATLDDGSTTTATIRIDAVVASIAPHAATNACSSSSYGLWRNCGWDADYVFGCEPGTLVEVGSSQQCGLGRTDGDSMLRICSGATACSYTNRLAHNDDACGGYGSRVQFTCPSSGIVTVMTANYWSGAHADVLPSVQTFPDSSASPRSQPLFRFDPETIQYQMSYHGPIPVDGTTASLDACGAGDSRSGVWRSCGFRSAGIGSCSPGSWVYVGTGACGLGSTTGSTSDSVLRICSGTEPCESYEAIASNDDACGTLRARAGFYCPSSGRYNAMVATYNDDLSANIEAAASTGTFPLTEWRSMCGDGVLATPVAGTWNPTTGDRSNSSSKFTFGCFNGAIGKCVGMGYKPWKKDSYGIQMTLQHQSCTRMVRNDICGNGTPFTVDGMPIIVHDNIDVQEPVSDAAFSLEGVWLPDGAYCIEQTRIGVGASETPGWTCDPEYYAPHIPDECLDSHFRRCSTALPDSLWPEILDVPFIVKNDSLTDAPRLYCSWDQGYDI